jgi:hypothetical protein
MKDMEDFHQLYTGAVATTAAAAAAATNTATATARSRNNKNSKSNSKSKNTNTKKRTSKHSKMTEQIQCKMAILKSYNEIKHSNPEWTPDIIVELFPEMKPFVDAEQKAMANKVDDKQDNAK